MERLFFIPPELQHHIQYGLASSLVQRNTAIQSQELSATAIQATPELVLTTIKDKIQKCHDTDQTLTQNAHEAFVQILASQAPEFNGYQMFQIPFEIINALKCDFHALIKEHCTLIGNNSKKKAGIATLILTASEKAKFLAALGTQRNNAQAEAKKTITELNQLLAIIEAQLSKETIC